MSAEVRTRLVALAGAIACAPFAHAQTIETYAGGARFVDSPSLDTPLTPGKSAAGPDGSIYVINEFNGQIYRYDPTNSSVTALPPPPNDYLWEYVRDVNIAADGTVYGIKENALWRFDLANGNQDFITGSTWEGQSTHCQGYSSNPARFDHAVQLATDTMGNTYVLDQFDNNVCRVTPWGGVDLFAGSPYGSEGFAGDGGPATSAQLSNPISIAMDTVGNMYIADDGNQRIRKVSSVDGTITTIAGTGQWGFNGDGIPAIQANLSSPSEIAVDLLGNLFVFDRGEARVRRIDAVTGIITTVAGNGDYGNWGDGPVGDGGPATNAPLGEVTGLSVTFNGDLYVSDMPNRRLRRVAADTGVITTVMGNGEDSYCGDNAQRVNACFYNPLDVALDAQGNVYVADSGNGRVRKIDAATGVVTTLAGHGSYQQHGGDGGPAVDATFAYEPRGVAVDAAGNVYIAAGFDQRIRRIDAASGIITTIAGNGTAGFSGDGGLASAARVSRPTDLIFDAAGNLYFSDVDNSRVRKIAAGTGIITTVAGNGSQLGPLGDGGPAHSARIAHPGALALDHNGNLLISDYGEPRIRRVNLSTGIISTIAGNGTYFPSGDSGPALLAGLGNSPQIAVEPTGNILVTSGWQVRRIDMTTGNIELLTFNMYSPDGRTIQAPTGTALGADGSLYVSDSNEQRIFRISDLPQAPIDTTPPTIEAMVQGLPGNDGWYRTDVRVIFITRDEQTAVERSGCDTVNVTQDTTGVTFTCTATSSGGTATESVTIKRDATPPTLSFGQVSPAPDANDWNNTPVTIGFASTDATSGVAGTSRESPLAFNQDGSDMRLDVVVHDRAGNSATFLSPFVHIDRTPPVVTPRAIGTIGNNGWYRSDVLVEWLLDDASYIDIVTGCGDSTVSQDTASVTFTCTARSPGGTTSNSITLKRDATAPALAFGAATPAPNANGWNKTNVSIPFTTSDALSGVASSSGPSPLVISAEGAAVTGQVVVTDQAGNAATFTSIPRNIDKTAPAIAITAPASGATYGFYQDVVADFVCNDVSLLTCAGPVADGELVNTRTAGARTFRVTSTDRVSFSAAVTHNFTVESAFNWEGFLAPANTPPTLNLVPRGALVPIRWKLPDGRGGFVSNTASFTSATVGSLSCGGSPSVPLNDTASGPAGISYDAASGTFTYNWQTNGGWTGCRKLTIKLRDNSTHELRFRFQ